MREGIHLEMMKISGKGCLLPLCAPLLLHAIKCASVQVFYNASNTINAGVGEYSLVHLPWARYGTSKD